ncbi:MAG: hypothetical protein IJ648_03390 [Lachnospiraceae bacterium]|nr:hypothetical protein [Lachnospiraceae bacterium]
MSDTIFYKLTLKRGKKPLDVFARMKTKVKKKGATKKWICEINESEEYMSVDFGDGESETLLLKFDKNKAEGFVKVWFALEGELFEDEAKSEFKAFMNMLYSAKTFFSEMEIRDDYALAEAYLDSKKYPIHLLELTDEEQRRVKRLYQAGYQDADDLLLAIMAEDLGLPDEFEWEDVINPNIRYNPTLNQKGQEDEEYFRIFSISESWLYETTAYKGKRLSEYAAWEYFNLGGVLFSVQAFKIGIRLLFFEDIYTDYRKFGPKDSQIQAYYCDRFFPMYWKADSYQRCEMAYQYMQAIYDFIGFTYLGKEGVTPSMRPQRQEMIGEHEELTLKELSEEELAFIMNICTEKSSVYWIISNILASAKESPGILWTESDYDERTVSARNPKETVRDWLNNEQFRVKKEESYTGGWAYDVFRATESFLYRSAEYRGKRLTDISEEEYRSPEIQYAIGGAVVGIAKIHYGSDTCVGLNESFASQYPVIWHLFKNQLSMGLTAEPDNIQRGILIWRYVLTVMEYFDMEYAAITG